MGELIADAVYRGVREALLKQNGKAPSRGVIERLEERGIYMTGLGGDQNAVEEILLSPEYAYAREFLECAFSLSDAHVMGQINGTAAFGEWARGVAGQIAGRELDKTDDLFTMEGVPPILDSALDAILTGARERAKP
jgi:hypothetical protein